MTAAMLLLALGWAVLAGDPAAGSLADLEHRVQTLEISRNVLLALSGGTLIGLILGWVRLARRADRLARRHVDELVARYPGAVERIVQEHETEARLRRQAPIALISDHLEIQALLRRHGFRELTTVPAADATSEELAPFAAVVLDLDRTLTPEAAAVLIESHPRDVFLAYSPHRVDLPPNRTTFANSPITLYARLMELLKFHEARDR